MTGRDQGERAGQRSLEPRQGANGGVGLGQQRRQLGRAAAAPAPGRAAAAPAAASRARHGSTAAAPPRTPARAGRSRSGRQAPGAPRPAGRRAPRGTGRAPRSASPSPRTVRLKPVSRSASWASRDASAAIVVPAASMPADTSPGFSPCDASATCATPRNAGATYRWASWSPSTPSPSNAVVDRVEEVAQVGARGQAQVGRGVPEQDRHRGVGHRDRAALLELVRVGRAWPEVQEHAALEERARPDLERRVLVERQAGVVELERDRGEGPGPGLGAR